MRLRTTRIKFRLPIVAAAAMVLALVGTAAVASASNSVDKDVAQTTIGKTTAPDTIREAGTAALPPLQPMDDDHDGWWNSGWWIVMPITMVIFWGGVIAVVVWVVRQFKRDRASPLDIARERLAGEIAKEEFERIRGDLA